MASFTDKVKVLIDVDSTGATSSLTRFKDEWKNAQTATDKWKVGTTAAMDFVKENIAGFAVAGAAALGTFAVKAVGAFKDLALQADEFSSKTGLAVEDASRWIEVSGDLGVDVESVATAMGKLSREIGSNPDMLRSLGDDAVYLDGGALDVNATFLNVIQRLKDIKDPAERAREGARLLGRGWQDMALLIQEGSSSLEGSLTSVSESKVIDEAEVQKARDFREAMDTLKDTLEDVTLTIGEYFIPIFTGAVEAIKGSIDIIGRVGGALLDATGAALGFGSEMGKASEETDFFNTKFGKLIEQSREADARLEYYNARLGKTTEETDALTWSEEQLLGTTAELNYEWQDLLGTLELEDKFRNAEEAIRKLDEKAAAAFGDPAKFDDYKDAQTDVIKNFGDILLAIGATDDEQNRVRFLVERGDLEGALELLNALNTAAQTGRPVPIPKPFYLEKRAMGGPVDAGTPYLVGEQGPEIFMPRGAGTIVPNHALGGGTTNITINMPAGSDGDDIVTALQRYARNNGELQLPTTTAVRR